jgi:hypothetical protein
MASNELKQWLQRLDQLMPSDGILTQSIVDAAGNPPLGSRRPDGPISREEAEYLMASRTIDQSYLNTTIGFKIDGLFEKRRDRRAEGSTEETAKLDASVRYWKSIAEWVQRL